MTPLQALGRMARRLRGAWLPVLLGVIGLLPFYSRRTFVGDIADSRFNMYVLEHGYQAMKHRAVAFWDAPFFYPHKNVIAYSDHHLGSLPLYSLFRASKLSREQAFQGWTLACLALTYLSGYLALRGFGAGRLAAGLAAYVFAFGLPMQAQAAHSQLLPRYLLPWVFVVANRWAARGGTRDFAWLAALMVGQVYLGVYSGILTAVTLGAYLLALALLGERGPVFRHLLGTGGEWPARAALLAAAGAALLPIAIPYWHASRELGMREWEEIAVMLPRLNSWLFPPPESLAWGWLHGVPFLGFRQLPLPGEHQLFAGLATLLSLLAWPFVKPGPGRLACCAHRAWWSLVFCFVLTLSAWQWTLWSLIFHVPGFGAVRGITRIALYMLFPMAMVLAAVLEGLVQWAKPRFGPSREGKARAMGAGCLLALAVVVDSGVSQACKTSFADSMSGVNRIKDALRAQGTPEVFWVCQGDSDADFKTNLDAMLAAQDLRVQTVNGYSGWQPPGYGLVPFKTHDRPPYGFYPLKAWLYGEGVDEASMRKVVVLDRQGPVAWSGPAGEYLLGTPVAFTQGHCEGWLEGGFSGLGCDGVWTTAPTAALVLRVGALPPRDLKLVVDADTAPLARGMHTSYRVRVNGAEIGSRRMDAPASFIWALNIPQAVARAKAGLLKIEIGSERVIPIRECVPASKDPRSVGIFLRSLRVE